MEDRVITFSDHAQAQLKERNLSRTRVLGALKKPDAIVRQGEQRFYAVQLIRRHRKPYALVVVYDETPGHIEIVTQFITSKIKKYL